MRPLIPLILLLGLAAACRGPEVPSPLVGQTRFLCCNFHYENAKTNDVNAQVGVLVPVGTPVTITKVYREVIVFQPAGFPEITFEHKYGRKSESMQAFIDHWFLDTDPTARIRRMPVKVRKSIEQAQVEPGMTKDQVLAAIGYPPAHETPSLASSQWTYWRNRWDKFQVFFDGDKVARVLD